MRAPLGKQCAEIFGETDETVLRAPRRLNTRSGITEEISKIIRPDLEVSLILTGMPSISAITLTGRGLANSVMNSISDFPDHVIQQ